MTVVLPYHLEAVRAAAPGAAVQVVDPECRRPSASPSRTSPPAPSCWSSPRSAVLPFASVFLRSLRGDEVVMETRLLSAPREWKRLIKAADLVLADALSVEAVRKAAPRRLREVRVVPEAALARLRQAVTAVVPQPARPAKRAPKASRKPPAATG